MYGQYSREDWSNTEMQRVKRLAKMEVRTTDPYYPWQNKYESVIKIINGKARRRRVHRNIPNMVWDFGMVWEADIYSRTAGKDGRPALEQSTWYRIDISEWLQF